MAAILRESDEAYWMSGGNGEATIKVCLSPGENAPSRARMIRPNGVETIYAAGQPELWIKRPEDGRYFFTFDGDEGWVVPYNGGECETIVMDERGGDPFKIPRACLVDVETAIEIVSHFLLTRACSPNVPWSLWNNLPLPDDWYE